MAVGEIGGNIALTLKQIEQVQIYAKEIIEMLPPKAINELLEGYNQDQEALLNEIFRQINNVVNFGATLESEKLDYLDGLERGMDMSLRKLSYNYFKTTCLPNFHQGWRNLDWGNLVQLFPWSVYLAARGHGKTEIEGTEVVMFDGSLKNIEDIGVGDLVMGIDSTPRTVLSTHTCIDDAYLIKQTNALDYVVNSQHILHFKRRKHHKSDKGKWIKSSGTNRFQIIEMSAEEFSKKSDYWKASSFGYRVDGWEMREKKLSIDPYILGLWLGDGDSNATRLTNVDEEIIDPWKRFAENRELIVVESGKFGYMIKSPNGKVNSFREDLRELNLLKNKHIPEIYFQSSKKQRLELLAGIIDTDGHLSESRKTFNGSYFEITLKHNTFARDVERLAWSLGFRVGFKTRSVNVKILKTENKSYLRDEVLISNNLHTIPTKTKRKKAKKITKTQDSNVSSLKVERVGTASFYGFYLDGDHLYLGKDGTVKHNSFEWCFAFSLWRLYSYDRPNYFQRDSIDNKNRKETMMITNESSLGITHLAKIIEEINHNDILKEKLNPNGKELGKTGFTTETGSLIKLRSLFSSGIRGNHVGSVVFDDLISESSLYSKEQRNKAKEIFYGAIVSVVEPHGFCVGSGTPYAHGDIYTDLKKDPKFKVFEYPAISPFYEPDGKLSYRLLSPDRFTYKHLLEVKESIGSSVFSREYLTTPVTDTSSLFPYEILNKCVAGMETISFAQNIESFPFKLVKVIVGCDFALSANIGADFSVFSVLGMDKDENFYLIYMWRKSGATHNEQINQIVSIDQRFRPNTIVCENNGFQSIISDLARGRGLRNIEEFTTTSGVKKNSYEGLPSIAAIMERGQLKFPYKEGETRELVETIMGEFHQVAFNEDTGKLEGVGSHDDCPMSIFMGLTKLRENTTKFRAHLL